VKKEETIWLTAKCCTAKGLASMIEKNSDLRTQDINSHVIGLSAVKAMVSKLKKRN